MCFNTFIQFIRQKKYQQLGFSAYDKLDCLFKPVHWFQFADDAAVVTTNERENQLLLNCFTKWCQWSNMVIRVDKCVTFGIKKFQLALFNMSQNYLSTTRQYPLSNQENHLNIWEDISTLKWTTKFIKKNCNPPLLIC